MSSHRIAVLPGDGIGPEVTAAARAVADAATQLQGAQLHWHEAAIGGAAIDATGVPLPAATLEVCRQSDAVLLGAVGGPKWDDPDATVRPEQGLLGLRKEMAVFANLRPVRLHARLLEASPLKPERAAGVDILFVRELTGGIYFGKKERTADHASDECVYSVAEIERVVRVACEMARGRRNELTSVDKANVLETSRLWRSVTSRVVAEEFPDVRVEHILVDAMAMHLLQRPADFDVVVTENMFGDILTDEASVLPGSLGLLPSASLGNGKRGVYEPVHGSAPDIAGRGIANPFGAILSAALMLRHSLRLPAAAAAVEHAVAQTIDDGILPADLTGAAPATTADIAAAVTERLGAEHPTATS